jgi:hypothetical protein
LVYSERFERAIPDEKLCHVDDDDDECECGKEQKNS